METKVCKVCGIEKGIQEFRKWFSKKDNNYYFRGQCRNCEKKISKEYYTNNKKYFINRYQNNKEKINLMQKIYRFNNKDKKRNYYLKNKEKIDRYKKEYYLKNKNKINDYKKQYDYNKRKNDNIYAFKTRVRHLIWNSFNKKGKNKSKKTEDILGCSLEFLYNYLLQTYKDNYGVDWDNIEPIHIDHIKPLKYAKTEEKIVKLCHYTNLQLLKAKDNLKKANKLDWELKN